jgi:hypothetical protein
MAKNKFENLSADELAKKLGVSLALPVRPAAASPADPFALVRGLQCQRGIGPVAVSGVYSLWELGGCYYHLDLKKPADTAAIPAYAPKEWMREAMPCVADFMGWLRTWMPANQLPGVFKNLWAGSGYIVDESVGLAMGSPPRGDWRMLSAVNEQGIARVSRRLD